MKRLHIMLLIFFVICFVADSIIAAYNYTNLRYISKGLLMPLLLAFFVTGIYGCLIKANKQYIIPVCLSLIFCFLGDVFLIENSNFQFMSGIAFFLIAHIFYIVCFFRIQPLFAKNILSILISGFIILSYVVLLDYRFWPRISKQNFAVAVITYSLVLGMMLFAAVNVINYNKSKKFALSLITGAIFFVASDSMIAFNKFYLKTPLPGFYIMSTYCLGQFLIVKGVMQFIKAKATAFS